MEVRPVEEADDGRVVAVWFGAESVRANGEELQVIGLVFEGDAKDEEESREQLSHLAAIWNCRLIQGQGGGDEMGPVLLRWGDYNYLVVLVEFGEVNYWLRNLREGRAQSNVSGLGR